MSKTIDEKIVSMKFDNASFEKNVQTSLKTLDNLKENLDMKGAAKGLEGIGSAAKGIKLDGLGEAVETVKMKFSALEVIAVTALANITNSALNAGKRMVSALTIDPIKTGLEEYETKMNAIQVIQANTKGKNTMDDITAALDELNKYADNTIYNFAQMTSNVGKFVAQGLDVKQATNAIQGMANLAAASGANAEDMSRATFQMSQALGGTIRKIDWNSLRTANMATTTLKETLMDLAKVNHIDIDAMIKDEGTFEDTLEKGWLSGDLFTQAMNIYSGVYSDAELKAKGFNDEQIKKFQDLAATAKAAATEVKTVSQLWDVLKEAAQSGWTQSWEYIIGDFESAKKTLTEAQVYFSEMIGKSADERNKVLKEWNDAGGRDMLIQSLKNAWEGILSVITPVKEAFREIFPKATATQLLNITKALQDFTSHLKIGEETSKNLKSTFKGVFALLDIGKQALTALFNVVKPLFGFVGDASGGILEMTGYFGDWLVKLDETIKSTDIFNTALGTIADTVKTGFNTVKDIVSGVLEKFGEFRDWAKENIQFPGIEAFHNLLQRVHDRMADITATSETLKEALNNAFNTVVTSSAFTTFTTGLEKIVAFLGSLWDGIKIIGKGIADAAGKLAEGFINSLGDADFNGIFDLVNGGLLAGLLAGIVKFVFGLGKAMNNIGESIGTFAKIKDAVLDTFGAIQENLKAKTLLKIAGAIALLTASLVVLSLIDSDKLTVALGAITGLFVELMGSMTVFNKISGNSDKLLGKFATAMIGVSVAVLILATAMEKMSGLDWNGVAKGLVAIAGLTTILVVTAEVLSKNERKMMKGMAGLLIFTFAVRNLVGAVEELGSMDWATLGKGLTGVGVLVAELAAFMVAAKFGKMGVGTGLGLMALAGAISILAISVQTFGNMDTAALIQGLVAMEAVLLELSTFITLNSGAKGMITTATGMVILGAAMMIFAQAVGQFGNMPLENMIQGLAGMAAVLTSLTIAMNLMPKNLIGIGIGMVAVGAALLIMSNALSNMGGMSWEEIAKGMVALAGGLAVVVVAVNGMNGALAGAAAMLVVSAALAVFAPMLVLLSTMSWEEIAKGMVALAGSFAVLGVAGVVLGPLTPVILGLAGAFALIGVGIAATGAGLLAMGLGLSALAAGFAALATLGSAGAIAVVAALTIIIEGVASMIPVVLTKIGEGLVALAQVIIQAAPVLVQAVVTVITAVVTGLVAVIPVVVDGIFQLLTAVLESIVEYTPTIVSSVMTILTEILAGIAAALPDIIQAGVDIIVAFIEGVTSASVQLVEAAFQAMITFINGLANCIDQNTPLLIEAMNRLMDSLINAAILVLTNSIEIMKERGKAIMDSGFIQGIKDKFEDAKNAVGDLITKILGKVQEKFEDFKSAGKNIVGGLIQGIKDKFQDAIDAASELGNKILDSAKKALGIASPSKEFAKIGRWSDLGLAKGLTDYASYALRAASEVGDGAIDAMQSSFGNISNVITGDIDLDPVIRPVLDLTDVTNGAKQIGSMFDNQKVGVSGSNDQNGGAVDGNGKTFSFIQNNYSPKALSRTEIYRQTKNQFSAMKGAVNNA